MLKCQLGAGTCAGLLIVVKFLFDEAIVLTLVLSLLSCGGSYQLDALTVTYFAETYVVMTLEFGGIMLVLLA